MLIVIVSVAVFVVGDVAVTIDDVNAATGIAVAIEVMMLLVPLQFSFLSGLLVVLVLRLSWSMVAVAALSLQKPAVAETHQDWSSCRREKAL